MTTTNILTFLASPTGADLLAEARALDGDTLKRLTRLRKRWPADVASAAVQMLELRARAKAKFEAADQMWFTPQGLEQSSGDVIANWRAAQFPADASLLDLCCGIGGDARALARRGPVYAFDMDPATALCARLNAQDSAAHIACADVTRLRLCGDAAFFDPSRRVEGRRVRDGSQYSPPLEFIRDILARVPNLAVKVSPALNDDTLEAYGARLSFVSDRGECKEAVMWFGDAGPREQRQAVLLPNNVQVSSAQQAPAPSLSEPRGWIYEPDGAVVRAHLVAQVAQQIGAFLMDKHIAYLTSDDRVPSPFVTAYRVVEWMPFNLKRLQARLRQLGRKVTVLKKRGVPIELPDISARLTGAGDVATVVILCRVNSLVAAVICDPPT